MMVIKCHRCGKAINSPDASNADYIMEKIEGEGTHIICPDCYQPDDKVIWGVHK